MLPTLDDLLAGIRTNALVGPGFYADLDCDDALDQRDSPGPFGSDWAAVYDATIARWNDVSSQIRSQVDDIRRESFLTVSRATDQHDIASYVSDDFDLLGRCQILGIEHPIVQHLWLAYQRGTFPLPGDYAVRESNEV